MKKLPTSGFNEQIQYNCGIQILLHHTQRNAYETDHVLDLEASLSKFQGTGKTKIIFSNCNAIKLEINNKEIARKILYFKTFYNTLMINYESEKETRWKLDNI